MTGLAVQHTQVIVLAYPSKLHWSPLTSVKLRIANLASRLKFQAIRWIALAYNDNGYQNHVLYLSQQQKLAMS